MSMYDDDDDDDDDESYCLEFSSHDCWRVENENENENEEIKEEGDFVNVMHNFLALLITMVYFFLPFPPPAFFASL